MCNICGRLKCPASCPNSEESGEVIFVCAKCKDKIMEGDRAYQIDDGVVWCDTCMMDSGFFA